MSDSVRPKDWSLWSTRGGFIRKNWCGISDLLYWFCFGLLVGVWFSINYPFSLNMKMWESFISNPANSRYMSLCDWQRVTGESATSFSVWRTVARGVRDCPLDSVNVSRSLSWLALLSITFKILKDVYIIGHMHMFVALWNLQRPRWGPQLTPSDLRIKFFKGIDGEKMQLIWSVLWE